MSASSKSQAPNHSQRAKWATALAALLVSPSLAEAARRAGVSEASLRRWLKNPRFVRLYRRARRDVVEHGIAACQQLVSDAVATLKRNLTCGVPAGEIRAAGLIIDTAFQGVENIDALDRLAEVERSLQEAKGTVPDHPGPWHADEDSPNRVGGLR